MPAAAQLKIDGVNRTRDEPRGLAQAFEALNFPAGFAGMTTWLPSRGIRSWCCSYR
ncbi:MAG: hypothetical protein AW07_00246 [Candidatus Accumulibacter sp. SK-11]|nr:MAG: hypothetical protein AW07_00246 [Candidatus Accumulibacter sp. SK-11]